VWQVVYSQKTGASRKISPGQLTIIIIIIIIIRIIRIIIIKALRFYMVCSARSSGLRHSRLGDGGQGARAPPPPKKREKYFSGN